MENNRFRSLCLMTVGIWLIFCILAPFFLMLMTSILEQGQQDFVRVQLTLENYRMLLDTVYLKAFLRSFLLAIETTFWCLLLAYPFSYLLSRLKSNAKTLALLLVMIPFWTSSLIRTYAIIALLKTKGIINSLLMKLGWIQIPFELLHTRTATLIGLVYMSLPLMILPLYSNLEKIDPKLLDAAKDLGANRIQTFIKIIFPLSTPGIWSGSLMVFLPSITLFYVPDLLGGARTILIGNIIQNQFLQARNWPFGAALSVTLTLFLCCIIIKKRGKNEKILLL